jgi:hypothetical protein
MPKKAFAVVLGMVLVISGCINLYPEQNVQGSTLYKGFKGLQISFVKDAPPKRVFENSPFNAIVKIENKGAYDVGFSGGKGIFVITPESGYVDVKEMAEDYGVSGAAEGEKNRAEFEVRGKSLSNPSGESIVVTATLQAKELSSLSHVHSSSVFATVCYPYETKLSTSVCIDADIHNLGGAEKACEAKDLVFQSGQGAPVAIKKIEVRMLPAENGKINARFLVHVENKGNGEIIKKDHYQDACKAAIEGEETRYFNVVRVAEAKLSNEELKCNNKEEWNKEVVLSGKAGVFRCEASIDAKNAYVAPLEIKLEYGYTTTISKEFNIESI